MKNTKLFLLLLLPFFLFSQEKEKRLALVIGNSNYDKGELKNPVNDANLIAQALDSLDFDVILATNLEDQRSFLNTIREFGNRRAEYDVGFVYYAGHGVQIAGENYLLPTKEIYESDNDIEDYAVNVAKIMKYLTAMTNQVNILILDACRDNPFEQNWKSTRSLKGGGLAKMPPPTGSLIAFSTDAGNTAADGDGENSIYCKSLVKNMLSENTTLDQVFRNVRTDVLEASNNMQRPIESSQLTGQAFYLVKSDYSEEIKNIEELVEKEKFIDALEIATSLAENDPSARSYLIRANIYTKTKNYQNAINDYLISLKLNPDSSEVLFLVGKLFYYSKQFEEAIDYLSQCINSDCNPEAYMYRARSAANLSRPYSEVLADWKKFNELFPNNPRGFYAMGAMLTTPEEKIKYYEKAIELEIQSGSKNIMAEGQLLLTQVCDYIADQYNRIGEYDKAIEKLSLAIEINPDDEKAYINKINFVLTKGSTLAEGMSFSELVNSDINNLLNKIKEISITNAYAARELSRYYAYITDFEKAEEVINRAIILDSTEPNFRFAKGVIFLNTSRHKEALDLYTELHKKYPKNTSISGNLAQSYFYIGKKFQDIDDFKNAIYNYKKAIEVRELSFEQLKEEGKIPKDPYLSMVYLQLYNVYEAMYYLHVNEANNDATFFDELGYDIVEEQKLYYQNKKREILLEGIDVYPDTYALLYKTLYTEFKEIHYLEKAVKMDSNYWRNYFGLYFAYIIEGDLENADKAIDKAIDVVDPTGSAVYVYKTALLLYLKRYEDCLVVIDELNEFHKINGYITPRAYSEEDKKYFKEKRIAFLSHLKSYLYYNAGREFESLVEITNSIDILSEIVSKENPDFSLYKEPHNYIPYDELLEGGIIDSFDDIKIDNAKIFLVEKKIMDKPLNNLEVSEFYKLYIIRANIFSKIGLDNKACEDYNTALQLTDEGSESRSEIEKLISENCN